MKRLISAITLITAASMASADHNEGIYIPLGIMGYDYDNSARHLDTDFMPTAGIGYRFNESWAAEVMTAKGSTDVEIPLLSGLGLEANVTHYRLDGLYFLDAMGDFTPFAVAGIGENQIDYDVLGNKDDTIVNAGAGVLYQLAEGLALRGDVRAIHSLDDNNTEAAVNLLVQMNFGSSSHRTAGAAAPIAAASVVSSNDGDGDGVPNGKDRCPSTPPGKTVDEHGCDCEYTLKLNFGFDSAALTDEDRAELDAMMAAIESLGRARATVAGHTDSKGDESYNQKLSQRRAQAVVDYLQSKGMNTKKLNAVGYGESRPTADNSTDAGRAENRRVVIERTDCAAQ